MALTHQSLLRNPSLYLKKRLHDPIDYVTNLGILFSHLLAQSLIVHSDAACLTTVVDDDYSVITTFVCNFIPAPPVGGNRSVRECSDYYFTDDDYLIWPQPFIPSLLHLPLISRRKQDLGNPDRIFLWVLPECYDFVLRSQDACTGLGKL